MKPHNQQKIGLTYKKRDNSLRNTYKEAEKFEKGGMNKEDVVNRLIHLRMVENLSTKSMLEILMGEYGYSKPQSYQYLKWMYQQIKEDLLIMKENAYEEAISRYEEQLEKTKDNPKMWNELHKEFSKLLGLYREKVDITSNGETINTTPIININVVNPKDK